MPQASYDFTGRSVLITGAAGDIGLTTARRLAQSGANLALLDLDEGKLRNAASELAASGVRILATACDVTNQAAVIRAVAEVEREFGRIDCLFNNAGYQGAFAPTHRYPESDFRKVMEVNVSGVYNVLTATAARMVESGGGAVVNTASHAGIDGPPNMLAYGASKAAVIAMTQSAAKDLAPYGIRVNAISPALIGPGFMWTRQCELQAAAGSQYFSSQPTRVEEQMISKVPLRRLGTLAEVSNAVLHLLSDEASYLTGFNMEITGGL